MTVTSTQLADLESIRAFVEEFDRSEGSDARSELLIRAHARRKAIVDTARARAVGRLLEEVMPSRRRRHELVVALGDDGVGAVIAAAEQGDPVAAIALASGAPSGREFALELAHLLHPEDVPLWAPWTWSPGEETGAFALMVHDPGALVGADDAATLDRLQEVCRYVAAVCHAAGLGVNETDPLSFDVLAAAVWATYAVTVVRLRMTKEFSQLLPPAVGFAERVLGLRRQA
jgi:hypothetical protein